MLNIPEELEVRITFTEAQIAETEKELRKIEDRILFLQGSLNAYNQMLDQIKKEQAK